MEIIDMSSSSPVLAPAMLAEIQEAGPSQPSSCSVKDRSKNHGRSKSQSKLPTTRQPPKPKARTRAKIPVTHSPVDVIDIDSDTSEQSLDSDLELYLNTNVKSKLKGKARTGARSPSAKRGRAHLELESELGARPPAKKARLSEAPSTVEFSFGSDDEPREVTSSDDEEAGSTRGKSAPAFGRASVLLDGMDDLGEGGGEVAGAAFTQHALHTPSTPSTRARTPLFLPDGDPSPHKSSPSQTPATAHTPTRRSVPPRSVIAWQPEAGPSKPSKRHHSKNQSIPHSPSPPCKSDREIVEVEAIPEEDSEPRDALARILEIVPDVDPAHAETLIARYTATHANEPERVVELTLHALLESPGYPKAPKEQDKGKGRAVDGGRVKSSDEQGLDGGKAGEEGEVDYMKKDRPERAGPLYYQHADDQLAIDFPFIPKNNVRQRLKENNGFYVPTYYALLADESSPTPPYTHKRTASKPSHNYKFVSDELFDRERGWLVVKLHKEKAAKDAEEAERLADEEALAAGEGVECGCCFTDYPIHKMAQCPEAHLFCTTCLTSYASNLLGEHNPALRCMDQSGCTALFSEDTLSCVLTPKLMELYHRVKLRKEIEAAGLEGLEECPFCEYRCVIENAEEKLFRCERKECGAVSCRGCKKLDHLPKSCKEIEDESKHLDARHAVEEAMTAALMRNCPKCNKAFVKEMGCNKMTCPDCRTISCYTCRQVILGYDHFNSSNGMKCALWDSPDGLAGPDRRHDAEVAAARAKALEQYKKDHPGADAHELKAVEVELAAPGGLQNAGRRPEVQQRVQHAGQRQRQHRQHRQQQLIQNAAGAPMVGLLDQRAGHFWGAGIDRAFGREGGGLNFGLDWGGGVPPLNPHMPIFRHPFAPAPPPPPLPAVNDAALLDRLHIPPPVGGQGWRAGQARAPARAAHWRARANAAAGVAGRKRQNR